MVLGYDYTRYYKYCKGPARYRILVMVLVLVSEFFSRKCCSSVDPAVPAGLRQEVLLPRHWKPSHRQRGPGVLKVQRYLWPGGGGTILHHFLH